MQINPEINIRKRHEWRDVLVEVMYRLYRFLLQRVRPWQLCLNRVDRPAMNIQEQLRSAVLALNMRGLHQAAKWAAEQLTGLEVNCDVPLVDPSSLQGRLLCKRFSDCSDRYLLAKTFFDVGEYQRAAHVLAAPGTKAFKRQIEKEGACPEKLSHNNNDDIPHVDTDDAAVLLGLSGEELFLKAYAFYLAGEQAKEQEMQELNNKLDRTMQATNRNLKRLHSELAMLYQHGVECGQNGLKRMSSSVSRHLPASGDVTTSTIDLMSSKKQGLDAFGLYIFGIVLRDLGIVSCGGKDKSFVAAQDILAEAAEKFPWNWSAWLDLAEVNIDAHGSTSPTKKPFDEQRSLSEMAISPQKSRRILECVDTQDEPFMRFTNYEVNGVTRNDPLSFAIQALSPLVEKRPEDMHFGIPDRISSTEIGPNDGTTSDSFRQHSNCVELNVESADYGPLGNISNSLDHISLYKSTAQKLTYSGVEHYKSQNKPVMWARTFFIAHACIELGGQRECEAALTSLLSLKSIFPKSHYLIEQLALANYNLRRFQEAGQYFEALRDYDPYRLDSLDTYSNILYVQEAKAALSNLAHVAMKCDKYRPETCCIVGNYYSLKQQHEKAVLYFQRALKLNRKFLAAWTLMGHEFVEMKNTGAAIEAYRRGVDVNSRDYRAWYGLGQTYELLAMYFYALYYYRKAVKLRPTDARMWCALGNCYKRLERNSDAIRCFERAAQNDDREGIAFLELARLYRSQGSGCALQAAENYRDHLSVRDLGPSLANNVSQGVAEALRFLAEYHTDLFDSNARSAHANSLSIDANPTINSLAIAAKYCSRLLEVGGSEEEWAKRQNRKIREKERHYEFRRLNESS